jgi:2-iminobutanoate/2-iminopropanoate deaminase
MVNQSREKSPVIQTVHTDAAPAPAGHYVQAIKGSGLIFVSGQLPVHADGSHAPHLSFEAQARQALANLLAIVEASGSRADHILKVTVFLVGVEHWPAFNGIYAEVFGHCRPARSVVPVPALHHGYLLEIEAVAAEL